MRAPYRCAVPVQVRFRDTDAMGHVNNAVFASYIEVARAAYWHEVFGLESYNDVDFILARLEIDFVRPVLMRDQLEVWLRISRIGVSSFHMTYELVRGPHEETVARAETVLVMYDYAAGAKKPVSDAQRRRILEYEQHGAVEVRG